MVGTVLNACICLCVCVDMERVLRQNYCAFVFLKSAGGIISLDLIRRRVVGAVNNEGVAMSFVEKAIIAKTSEP